VVPKGEALAEARKVARRIAANDRLWPGNVSPISRTQLDDFIVWAAVGVVRPPASARLTAATDEGGRVTLRYDLGGDGTLEYRAQGGRLQSVRRLRGGGVQESVDLERAADGSLKAARYRDQAAYRSLNLTLESSTDVASFADDVWSPPGTGR